jgi:hypothetical protein
MNLVVTGAEQGMDSDWSISARAKYEITQGLTEGHGADKGIAVAVGNTCRFFDFETREELNFFSERVQLFIACL